MKSIKTPFVFIFLFFICAGTLKSQIQIGSDIDGEFAGDQSGYAVAMPDENTVAIGAVLNDGVNGVFSGHVRVFTWNGSTWVQKGADIDGEAANDNSGRVISMPDANTVAIGAAANGPGGSLTGHVRIYEWNGTAWVQKGLDIDGVAPMDSFGWSVSMPNENTFAAGGIGNDDNGNNAGHVRVFTWNGSAWVQKGSDIDGEAPGDQSGYSISMPDVNTVAIGAHINGGTGSFAGHVRIFEWNGSSWVQKGADIDGEAPGDQSGFSVSMPDINTVAIGAHLNDGNGSNSGHVRVYEWNGSTWVQKGMDIDGEAVDDRSGRAVSMPNANTVAIGASQNDGNGTSSGHVRIYRWDGSAWIQSGSDIDGEAAFNQSGFALNMPTDRVVAIGAYRNNGNGLDSGHARVYSVCETYSTVSPSVCGTYTSPSGKVFTSSGSYQDTIANNAGCDSIITILLTVNSATTASISPVVCDSYTSPAGIIFTSSGTYQDTITNAAGCDSLITINLTVNSTTTATISPVVCGSYTSPGGSIYASSGTYQDTILNATGCDSVISINLTVNSATAASISPVVCGSYTAPSGAVYNTSGTFLDTIPNSSGCDSVISISLTVNTSSASSLSPVVCDSYTSPGGSVFTASGTYLDTIPNSSGCDSIITIALTVNNSTSSTISPVVCDSYTSPGGSIYISSGTYLDTISSASGCDSIITINLTVDTVDVTVTNNGTSITANATGASFQWLDCDNGLAPLSGDTGQSFIPLSSGNYAVEVTQNNCVDTSFCEQVILVAMQGVENEMEIKVFPNPNRGYVTIDLGGFSGQIEVVARNSVGREVLHKKEIYNGQFDIELNGAPGWYFLEIRNDQNNIARTTLIKL